MTTPYGASGAQDAMLYALANLHNLAESIGLALRAGQTDAADALRPQFDYWAGQYQLAVNAAYPDGAPSTALKVLDTISDFSIFSARAVAGVAQTVTNQAISDTGAAVKAVTPLLWPLAIVAAVIGVVYLRGRRGAPVGQ